MKLCAANPHQSLPLSPSFITTLTLNNCVTALAGDIFHRALQVGQIRRVKAARDARSRRRETLEEERHAERVQAILDEVVDAAGARPGVVGVLYSGDVLVTEFGAGSGREKVSRRLQGWEENSSYSLTPK